MALAFLFGGKDKLNFSFPPGNYPCRGVKLLNTAASSDGVKYRLVGLGDTENGVCRLSSVTIDAAYIRSLTQRQG